MADTVSVTQALLMARSWLPHASACAAVNPKPTGDGYDAQCTCGLTEKLQVIDSALASTQPAPAFPREEVAKAIATLVTDEMTNARNAMRGVDAVESSYRKGRYDAAQSIGLRFPDTLAALLQGKQP